MTLHLVSLVEMYHLSGSNRIWLVLAAEDSPEIPGAETALVERTPRVLRDREATDTVRIVASGGGASHTRTSLRIGDAVRLVETHAIHEELARLGKTTTGTPPDGLADGTTDALLHVFHNSGLEKRDGGTTRLAQSGGTILE